MAQIDFNIEYTRKWVEEKTTLQPCSGCNEVIFGKTYRLWMTPVNERIRSKFIARSEMMICQSCMDLLNKTQNGSNGE